MPKHFGGQPIRHCKKRYKTFQTLILLFLLEQGDQLSSEVGIFNYSKCGKDSKSSHIPKILKHYIRKQTSFNNVWTALLKSELNGVCDLKIPPLDCFRNNTIKHSVSANNPNLLEVYSSKIQAPESFSRLVNSTSPSKCLNISNSSTSIAKTSCQQGSPCKADLTPKDQPEISHLSVLVVKNQLILVNLTLN